MIAHLFATKTDLLQTTTILLLIIVGCSIVINPLVSAVVFTFLLLTTYIFFKPHFGLALCIATAPILILEILHESPTRHISDYYPLSLIFIPITFSAWSVRRLVKLESGSTIREIKYFLPLFFISYAIISLLWTIDLRHGFCITSKIVAGLCLFFMLNDMITDRQYLEKTIAWLPFLGLILALMTLISKLQEIEILHKISNDLYLQILFWSHEGTRPSGFANSALAANSLVFFIFMTIAAYPMAANRFRKVLLIIIALFCLSMMFLISSKAAVGSLLVGTFFIIFRHPALRKKALVLSLLVFMILASVYTLNAVFIKGGERLTGSKEVAATSLSSRLGFWQTGFSYFKNRWTGAGAGGILEIMDPIPNSHSTYFSILFDFGLVGFSVFMTFIFHAALSLKRAIKNCSNKNLLWILFCISGAFIALLIHALVDNFHYSSYFWLVLGLLYTSTTIAKSDISPSPST